MRASWKRAKRRRKNRRQTHRKASGSAPRASLYEPLPSQSSIRLITLHPGDVQDPIRCTLEVFDLPSAPAYEAISYIWGDPRPRRRIRCNGRRFLVADNLGDAIRNVRRKDEDRVIWVDALCVNQSNLGERSHQVLLMRDIYTQSKRTLICLDIKPSTGSGKVYWQMVYKAILLVAEWSVSNNWNLNQMFDPRYKKSEFPPQKKEYKALLNRLFSCKWFQRVWVIQEVVVSAEAVFIVNGMEWDWHSVGLAACRLVPFVAEISEFFSGDSIRGVHQAGQMWMWTRHRRDNIIPDLLDSVKIFSLALATDSRDLIYSLLGISKEQSLLEEQIRTGSSGFIPLPNYEDAVRDVFTDWCRYFIESSGSLDLFASTLLAGIGSPDDHSSFIPYEDERGWTLEEASFPSWVPHWDRLSRLDMRRGGRGGFEPLGYQASGEYPVRLSESPRRDTIIPSGVIADTVEWTGEVMYQQSFPRAGMQIGDHAIIGNYLKIAAKLGSYPNGDTVDNAYAIAAAAGHPQQKPVESISSPGGDMLAYCAWLISRMTGGSEDITRMLQEMRPDDSVGWNEVHAELVEGKCVYRRFFVTERGFLGLGPGTAEVGDLVCVIFGGKTPFILRKVSDHYKLIGESYIHGLMDGEVIKLWEAGVLSEQWFEIR
ncbi:hypothetical protein L207DRAFT_460231 [Hyaloscypha variabilis F]|uniref:Heterokaryon incompatibility domain-containing protein n=1 Tax=Hyaloscypha variabilis (strain UAMH 11265 / GT02V1 / F) TaxID=1149755 RepID=A0A2J6RM22_HYAVF|nr:hypothetical protein L207DRAFT_460231 [Hyaloscypha variabilis F]